MIMVDVRDMMNPNVERLEIMVSGSRVECGELIERCKMLLNVTDSLKSYGLKQNQVFIHPTQYIQDGETVFLTEVPDGEYDDD